LIEIAHHVFSLDQVHWGHFPARAGAGNKKVGHDRKNTLFALKLVSFPMPLPILPRRYLGMQVGGWWGMLIIFPRASSAAGALTSTSKHRHMNGSCDSKNASFALIFSPAHRHYQHSRSGNSKSHEVVDRDRSLYFLLGSSTTGAIPARASAGN